MITKPIMTDIPAQTIFHPRQPSTGLPLDSQLCDL